MGVFDVESLELLVVEYVLRGRIAGQVDVSGRFAVQDVDSHLPGIGAELCEIEEAAAESPIAHPARAHPKDWARTVVGQKPAHVVNRVDLAIPVPEGVKLEDDGVVLELLHLFQELLLAHVGEVDNLELVVRELGHHLLEGRDIRLACLGVIHDADEGVARTEDIRCRPKDVGHVGLLGDAGRPPLDVDSSGMVDVVDAEEDNRHPFEEIIAVFLGEVERRVIPDDEHLVGMRLELMTQKLLKEGLGLVVGVVLHVHVFGVEQDLCPLEHLTDAFPLQGHGEVRLAVGRQEEDGMLLFVPKRRTRHGSVVLGQVLVQTVETIHADEDERDGEHGQDTQHDPRHNVRSHCLVHAQPSLHELDGLILHVGDGCLDPHKSDR